MSVKLSPSLPADDRNGMPAVASSLVDNPDEVHAAVILVRTKEIRTNARTGDVVPTAEILAAEAFTSATEDSGMLRRLLRRQHERRTGSVELPLELEEALDAITVPDPDDDGDQDGPSW